MKSKKKTYRLSAVFWKEGRHVVGKCPEIGVSSFGQSLEDAKARLQEAVDLYIENAKALGIMRRIEEALSSPERFTTILEVTA
jgi:predicted RNase H-like HicB family nuclease